MRAGAAAALLGALLAVEPVKAWARAEETAEALDDAQATARARALARAEAENDGSGAVGSPGMYGMGSLFSRRSGLLGTGLMALAFYFLFMRGRGAQGNTNWGSYYLFWIVGPALIAVVSSHPAVLLVVVVGLVARRWLPDPYLALKYQGRIRALNADVSANPGNITARRDLATIWLEKRRPRRALPLVDQALARDPSSHELLFLRGVALLHAKQPEPALEALLGVVHQEPGFRYGEAYLRAADALIPLERWEDAEEALGHFLKINSSSIEALFKLARVRKQRGDYEGATRARAELRDVWRVLPSFQRRKQLGWYLRSMFGR
jgi:tetratricopeptide (TPR) repeat protein